MLQCHISHTVQSTWLWTQYILMCSSTHQCCVSCKTTQTSIRTLFYFHRFLTIISQEHTMKIVYSAEEGFQTKWICNSLHQKLSTELRQNNYFFFFLKKRMGREPKNSPHLCCRALYCVPCEQNWMPQYCQRLLGFRALVFPSYASSFSMLILYNFLIKTFVFPNKHSCSIPNMQIQRNDLNTFTFLLLSKRDAY